MPTTSDDHERLSTKKRSSGEYRALGLIGVISGAALGGAAVRYYQFEHPHVAAVPIESGLDLQSRCTSTGIDANLSCLTFLRTVIETSRTIAEVRPDACFFRVADTFTILQAKDDVLAEMQKNAGATAKTSATSLVISMLNTRYPCK